MSDVTIPGGNNTALTLQFGSADVSAAATAAISQITAAGSTPLFSANGTLPPLSGDETRFVVTSGSGSYALTSGYTGILIGLILYSPKMIDSTMHCLLNGGAMPYDAFLDERRRRMANVVRAAWDRLRRGSRSAQVMPTITELITGGETEGVEFKSTLQVLAQ